jgi:hypothetical protein
MVRYARKISTELKAVKRNRRLLKNGITSDPRRSINDLQARGGG